MNISYSLWTQSFPVDSVIPCGFSYSLWTQLFPVDSVIPCGLSYSLWTQLFPVDSVISCGLSYSLWTQLFPVDDSLHLINGTEIDILDGELLPAGVVGNKTPVGKMALDFLLPKNKSEDFYFYNGSLTTPGCNEGLNWHVFTDTIPISKEQLVMLRSVVSSQSEKISENYRFIQPLNDRKVLQYRPFLSSKSSSTPLRQNLLYCRLRVENS